MHMAGQAVLMARTGTTMRLKGPEPPSLQNQHRCHGSGYQLTWSHSPLNGPSTTLCWLVNLEGKGARERQSGGGGGEESEFAATLCPARAMCLWHCLRGAYESFVRCQECK
jgi:hypothetical protein